MAEPPAAARRRPTVWQRLLLVVFGLGVAGVLLVAAEGLLTLLGAGEEHLHDDPFVGFAPGDDLFALVEKDDGRKVWATRPAKLAFFNEQEFPATKAPGTLRVFVVGGSTVAGRPYDDRVSFARWLERYLDAAEPGRRHEVINAGGISYASYRLALLMRELVRYEPDLFVVYTGHNEFLEERTYGDLLRRPPALLRLQGWLSGWRLGAVARQAAARLGSPEAPPSQLTAEVETRLEVWRGIEAFRRDDELAGQIVTHFGLNLDRIVSLARDAGAEVMLVAPVSNLKDFSPFRSQPSAATVPAALARLQADLAASRELLARGDAEGAEAAARRAVEVDPRYAEGWYRLGAAQLALGRAEEAANAFVRAKDEDVVPLRAPEAIVAAVREVAERRDVPLLDLPALLAAEMRRRAGHGIVGSELLLDHVHLDIPVHQRVAENLLDMVAAQGLAELGDGLPASLREKVDRDALADLDVAYYARRDLNLAKVLGWAGKLEEAEEPLLRAIEALPDEPDAHLQLGILYQKTGRAQEAVAELERAVELAPGDAAARFNLGVALGNAGRLEEAIAALEIAVERRPDYAEAWHDLGVLRREAGRLPEALAALERAEALAPGELDVQIALGRTLIAAGRTDEGERRLRQVLGSAEVPPARAVVALAQHLAASGRGAEATAELERLLARDPTQGEARFVYAQLLGRQGRSEAAERAYRELLQAEPRHAGAHNNLGILLAGLGRLDEAGRELQAAVDVAPGWAEAWLNLGVVHDRAGRPDDAVAALRRAHDLAPEDPRIRLALGLLLQARGRSEEARPHLEAARRAGLSGR